MPGTIEEAFATMNSNEGITNGIAPDDGPTPPKVAKKLTVEKIYQKKTQLEHILLRPDTYIGSVEPVTEVMWVFDDDEKTMVQKEITYVPGLYKIYDEILVNAADNKQRDQKMDCIKIEIDPENNVISVWNNGQGIPVVMHKDEKMMVPTMIFGHLLTSSNYNDEEEKVTGGRNGYGAKLCNIFSTKFTVETASKEYKKSFKQVWANNMSKTSEPKVKENFDDDYTKITFSPDLSKFKMECLDKDIVQLLSRRAYDVAASTRGVKVFLNGKRIPVKSFKDYIELYVKKGDEAGNPLKIMYEDVNPRWEVALTLSDKGFQQVSFVNSIATTKGGRHVDHVSDMIVKQLMETIKKKVKGGPLIRPFQVKNHMWLFINCLIVNPTFDSQTKENMTLQAKSFGSKCHFTDKFSNIVSKSGIVDAILMWAKFKQDSQLKAQSGKKKKKLKGIPKLEDANFAGTRSSLDCTLILTEGDSAKSLAMSGLSVVGHDNYGVFPLKGKLLNVREATHKQVVDNNEINSIVQILGLQYHKKYESIDDLKTLRYGKLMIMTDQDQDGSHIKGLLINFIHHNWPTLLKLPFLEEFITPILKATKNSEVFSFYSLPEFEEWKASKDNWHTYKIKYYKGLGTSSSKEAKEYFLDMERHRITFHYGGPNDDSNINMAFSKKCAEQRKEWLTKWMEDTKRRRELGLPEQYLYEKNTKSVNYSDFVNKELVLFSNCDNERSIPSMVDGLKPGQRKVLFTCLKRNDKREVKVAQLAGSVAEHSAYHHGEQSLMSTIINLAQNFVGSNNINLLQPSGQFGTRLTGGKDAASPRYIYTMLSPLTRYIFHPHDEPLLSYQFEDNQKIEPVWYIPIIPMILVNGADGIGTGWMTKIPNYNPREIAQNLLKMINGEEPTAMVPWYKNFRGVIDSLGTRHVVFGEVAVLSEERLEITELPIGVWTQTYKENVLEPMLHGVHEKVPPSIQDYKEYNTDTTVRFEVIMTKEKLAKAEEEGFYKFFKLQAVVSATSMCAFDENGCIQRYDTVGKFLQDFYKVRMEYYKKRKTYLEGILQVESQKISNQARFILEKCDGVLVIENKKRKLMIEELHKRGYDPDPVRVWKMKIQNETTVAAEEEDDDLKEEHTTKDGDMPDSKSNFDYLLGMPLWSLTKERKDDLLKKRDEKLQEYDILKAKSPSDIWREDLDAFLKKLDEVEAKELADNDPKAIKGSGKKGSKKKETMASSDTKPSAYGRRILPHFNAELIKKFEKADIIKEKGKRTKKPKEGGDNKDDDVNEEAKGEKPARKSKEPKPKSKDLPKKKGKGKKPLWGSDSDTEENSDDEFSPKSQSSVSQPTRTVARRTAAAKVKFTYDSNDESNDDDMELHDNTLENGEGPVTDQALDDLLAISDTDSEFESKSKSKKMTGTDKEQETRKSSDAMFDSLVATTSAKDDDIIEISDNEVATKKKAPAKKKLSPKTDDAKPKRSPKKAATKKKLTSDSDDDIFEVKAKKGKKKAGSDDSFTVDDPEFITKPPSRAGGRAKKPAKYNFDDSSSD